MTWLMILDTLIRLFGPILIAWLEKVLNDAARSMPERPSGDTAADLTALFARARRGTWVWQRGKRYALRLAERAALDRADEIRRDALHGPGAVSPLDHGERVALRMALAS